MSIKLADCVRETSTTIGTGTLTLSGTAPAIGDRTFSTAVSAGGIDGLTDGCTTVIRIEAVDVSGNPTGEWEITESVYTVSGNTATRGTFRASSTGSRVSFSAGTKYVSVVAPASMIDTSGGTTVGTPITGAYTLALTDLGKLISSTSATDYTITVPHDGTGGGQVNWAAQTTVPKVIIYVSGTGLPTIAGDSGVTIVALQGAKALCQYSHITLEYVAANTWNVELTGYMSPAGQANTATTLSIPVSWVDTDNLNTSNNASTQTLTIQAQSVVPTRIGAKIAVQQLGAGKITLAAGTDGTNTVTFRSANGYLSTNGTQYSVIAAEYEGTVGTAEYWSIVGQTGA